MVLLNVLSFFDPLRELIRNGISEGFIQPGNDGLIIFVEGPSDPLAHETYDWGKAGLRALDEWQRGGVKPIYDWTARVGGKSGRAELTDAA